MRRAAAFLVLLAGCGAEDLEGAAIEADRMGTPAPTTGAPQCEDESHYASEVVSFTPGLNAGYGQANMPDVVLGPPAPGSSFSGSLDVVSLGAGGEIVLGFGEHTVTDGPGADFIVWENPFFVGGDVENPYAELGEVSVSLDGEEWHAFPCDPLQSDGYDPGCAGWRPRTEFDPCTLIPLDPSLVGGDAFDLADVGLSEIRYVRIRDLAIDGGEWSAGFDLDAVGAVHR